MQSSPHKTEDPRDRGWRQTSYESPRYEGHNHHITVQQRSGKSLLFTLVLNFIIPTAQIVGGVYAHSMALIGDAVHNFGDFAAVLIAYFAFLIGRKKPTPQNTFGYKRAEVMAALINAGILVVACGFILYEASQRLMNPKIVLGRVVIWLACVGIVGNGLSALVLHRESKHSLNVRGVFLHMLGDFLTSVVVLLNGVVLLYRPWYWLDPALSVLIAVFILKNSWEIMKEAGRILMNFSPSGLNLQEIKDYLLEVPGVDGVHYLHLWNISASNIGFSCHVEVPDQSVRNTQKLAKIIRQGLLDKFGIDHTILQFETDKCGSGGMLCELVCSDESGLVNHNGTKDHWEKG